MMKKVINLLSLLSVFLFVSCSVDEVTPLVVDFEISIDSDKAPAEVTVTNITTGATSFSWVFNGGDPVSSTEQNPPVITYTVGGDYTISLEASNGTDTETVSKNFTLTSTPTVTSTQVIEAFNPENEAINVPLNSDISVTFTVGLEQSMTDSVGRTFRLILDGFEVFDDLQPIEGNLDFSEENDIATFQPAEIFPAEVLIRVNVNWHWEELVNEEWIPLLYEENPVDGEDSFSFTTEEFRTEVTSENIAVSYPMPNQYHFLKSEYEFGYLMLKGGVYFNEGVEFICSISDMNGNRMEMPLTYIEDSLLFRHSIPSELQNETIYNLQYKMINGGVEQVFHDIHFRTSMFDTFLDKYNSFNISSGWRFTLFTGVHELGANMSGVETLDFFESSIVERPLWEEGSEAPAEVSFDNGLVRGRSVVEDNDYFDTYIYPLIYESFDPNEFVPVWRETPFSIPPVETIAHSSTGFNLMLTEEQIANNIAPAVEHRGTVRTRQVQYYYWDYVNLRNQLQSLNIPTDDRSERVQRLLTETFPVVRAGEYKLMIYYFLPGINKVTSEREVVLTNPL